MSINKLAVVITLQAKESLADSSSLYKYEDPKGRCHVHFKPIRPLLYFKPVCVVLDQRRERMVLSQAFYLTKHAGITSGV